MTQALQDTPVQYIKGIGPKRAKSLARLGINTLWDALLYLPFRYEDRRVSGRISDLRYDTFQAVSGRVLSAEVKETPRGKMKIFELVITDGSGVLTGKWFNQPYLKRLFRVGDRVILSGVVKRNSYWGVGYEMHSPEFEVLEDEDTEQIHSSRIVPVYRSTGGLTTRQLRSMMHAILSHALNGLSEYMPEEILSRYRLPPLREAIQNIHFPSDRVSLEELNELRSPYHQRLAFDELFFLQAGLAALRRKMTLRRGVSSDAPGRLRSALLGMLPFSLTGAQKRVVDEIIEDMRRPYPMNRLLQGDVGSGKTVVALLAMLQAVESGYQAALMAPTEILAEQHYLNIHPLLEELGLRVALLTGSTRQRPLDEISSGQTNIVVGTHALIQGEVKFKHLGLVVIDEQHRFGVLQRAALRRKGANPDVLVMTATPIPRTLSLTMYGDLNYSVIDELPPNRRPIVTKHFRHTERGLLRGVLRGELRKGRQVYMVYPAIEDSERFDLKSVLAGEREVRAEFPEYRVGVLHGRMRPQEREETMRAFKEGEIDILVCTTVVEVGVDVPNASVMVIEHAERFGLAQLHQLRGRVGRGPYQSYCFLVTYGRLTEEARRRVEVMVKYQDGFRIAEEDFRLRGPGELFGTKQSGMPDLKVADLLRHSRLLAAARQEAFKLVEEDGELRNWPLLRQMVERFWKGKVEIFRTS